MTDSFDNAPDPDDRPHAPVPPAGPATATPMPPRRGAGAGTGRAGRLLRWWLGISFVVMVACIVCLVIGLNQFDFTPLHIVIDGDDVTDGVTIQGISQGGRVLLATGALMLGMLALLLVPMLLLLVLGIVAVALVAGIALPIVAVALALLAVSSPLWIVGLVIWLIVRDRRPSRRPPPSATMAA